MAWNRGVLPGPFIFPLLSQGSLTPNTSTQNHLLEPPCILSCSTRGRHTHPVPLLDLCTRDSVSSQVVSLPSALLALTTWKHTGDPSALSTETLPPCPHHFHPQGLSPSHTLPPPVETAFILSCFQDACCLSADVNLLLPSRLVPRTVANKPLSTYNCISFLTALDCFLMLCVHVTSWSLL